MGTDVEVKARVSDLRALRARVAARAAAAGVFALVAGAYLDLLQPPAG